MEEENLLLEHLLISYQECNMKRQTLNNDLNCCKFSTNERRYMNLFIYNTKCFSNEIIYKIHFLLIRLQINSVFYKDSFTAAHQL